MNPSLALICFYQDVDDYVVRGFKKCMNEVKQKANIPVSVAKMEANSEYARCLDGETIYGKDSDGS